MPSTGFEPRVAIIGGGFGGIATAVKLQQRGIGDFVIFERSPKPGGTWYDNTYPGCEVDIPSRVYSFSFLPYDWSRTHCRADELQGYAEAVVDRFGLRDRFRFGTGVTEVRWDERGHYRVHLDGGGVEEFDVVVSAVGFLNIPNYPSWPGLDEFAGPVFHTSRYEHQHDLRGRRVGIVGTGSTSIQATPEIAEVAGHLSVFQREPGWIMPKWNHDYRPRTRALYRRFPVIRTAARFGLWSYYEVAARAPFRRGSLVNRLAERLCHWHIDRQIKDPELRRQVTPTYPFGCKRPIWADTYYPALLRDNVTLVPRAVQRVTRDSVVTDDGREYPVDVLIIATGFQPQRYLASLKVHGTGGHTLDEAWNGSPAAFLGITISGFPNFFILYGPNTNGGNAITFQLERQAEMVARTVARMRRRGIRAVDTRRRAYDGYIRWIDRQNATRFDVATYCRNYYFAPDGRNVTQWPRGGADYWLLTRLLPRFALVPLATSSGPHPPSAEPRADPDGTSTTMQEAAT